MRNNSIVLIKTLLRSTGQFNILKYSKDKKKKNRIRGNFAAYTFLYIVLMAYCVLSCIGLGSIGMIGGVPMMCAILISAISFLFGVLQSSGFLFNFKEYDMLMALPFTEKNIAGCRFAFMYFKNLPWYLSISLAMLIGYAIFAKPPVFVYPLWLFLSLILPVIPMVIASGIGFLITKIGSGFKKKTMIQTVLSFMIVIGAFGFRFFADGIFREGELESTLQSLSNLSNTTGTYYPPAGWFSGAITQFRISDMLLLVGVSLLLFEIVFYFVGKSYRKINSALKSTASSGKFNMTKQKKRSILNAIAFKEFKRMTGSSTYMVNATVGELLCFAAGIVVLFVDFDTIISVVLKGAPISKEMLYPAIPLIIYFFIGMMATTVCSPSLEGKNYWIVQSLPITKQDLYKGKMLFNMYLTVPISIFTTICFCISAGVPLIESALYVVLSIILCAFSTTWGCVCGIKHMRLDWENEIEVIKQGSATSIYLLPNMFVTMALIVGTVVLGMIVDHKLITLGMILILSCLCALCYKRALSLGERT